MKQSKELNVFVVGALIGAIFGLITGGHLATMREPVKPITGTAHFVLPDGREKLISDLAGRPILNVDSSAWHDSKGNYYMTKAAVVFRTRKQ